MNDANEPITIPYLSFKTFITGLDKLKEHNLPSVIDPSFLNTFFSGTNTRLFSAALNYFELTNENGEPKEQLERLVYADPNSRKVIVKQLLEEFYPQVLALDLARATPNQFETAISVYGLSGDTKRKAKTFLIHAIQFAQIPISEIITKRSRKRTNDKKTAKSEPNKKPEPERKTKSGESNPREVRLEFETTPTKTVALSSGKRIALIVEAHWFDVTHEERNFIIEVTDLFDKFEKSLNEDSCDEDGIE